MARRDWLRPVRHAAARLSDALNSASSDKNTVIRSPNSAPVLPAPPASASNPQRKPDLGQYGASGTPIVSGFVTDMQEYLPELRGRAALGTYEKMRRSDADCAAIAAACKLPIRAAEFKVIPGVKENQPDFAFAKQIAEDVEDMLFGGLESTDERGNTTSQSFESVIENALLCLDYGVSGYEDLWVIDRDRVRLRKMASRLPLTFWQFPVEADGETLQAVVQWGYRGDKWVTATVPASKFTLFSYRKEGANFYGRSMFREAYQHWYVKNALYRIDSIACERNGMGIPTISGEGALSEEDKVSAGDWLQNVSANENLGLLLPPGRELKLIGVTGQAHDILPSIQHHSEMICRSALAMFMSLGTSQTGSRALGNVMVDFFQLSEEATARFICETIRETSIRRYCDFNYAPGKSGKIPYPRLIIPNIAVINPLDIMVAMKDVADSKLDFLQPDDETEDWLRKKIGMPLKSKSGGRTRFSPVSVRVSDDQSGSPEDIEAGKGTPAPAAGAKPPAPGLKPAVKKKLTDSQQLRELEGRRKWHGLDISIENEKGSTRSGTALDGKAWSVQMLHPYGYIRRTEGVDGDHVDCFMGDHPEAEFVFVIHQVQPSTGAYDEDKCMLDFLTAEDAKAAFLANYDRPDFFHSLTMLPVDEFIEKVKATSVKPSKITARESLELTRELMPHEKKHDFAGHCLRADKTQTAIRRILAGASPGLQRVAVRRAGPHPPDQLGALSIPFDRSLQARIARAVRLAYDYGHKQVYSERYRATKRPRTEKPIRAMLSNVPSAEQDTPTLIAQAAVADLQNSVITRAKAAHIDLYKKGVRDEELIQAMEDMLQEMSDGYLDRIAMEAARSGVVGGRFSAFRDLSGEIKSYARSEAMDQNTCGPCQDGDGVEWASLDEVDWSPGDDCDGGDACRGQLMPIFEDEGTVEVDEGDASDEET